MNIVLATMADINLLTEMNIQLREDEKIDNAMTNEQVKERMYERLSSTCKAYLFSNEQEIYGYALVDHSRTPVYLCQIYIQPEYRSHGFGRKYFIKLLEFLNIKEIDVEVLMWNERAQQFYKDIGFNERYIGFRYNKE